MSPKRERKPQLIYAMALSLLFALIDGAAFSLLAEPLGRWITLQPVWLNNGIHTALIATVGTLIGCTAIFALRTHSRLVPMAYSFFPVYMLICYAYAYFNLTGNARDFAYRIITLYTLAPTLVGMVLSWAIWWVWSRRGRGASA